VVIKEIGHGGVGVQFLIHCGLQIWHVVDIICETVQQ